MPPDRAGETTNLAALAGSLECGAGSAAVPEMLEVFFSQWPIASYR